MIETLQRKTGKKLLVLNTFYYRSTFESINNIFLY